MSRSAAAWGRGAIVTTCLLALLGLAAVSVAKTLLSADLVLGSVASPPATVAPGGTLTGQSQTKNSGKKKAPKTATFYFLSLDAKKDAGDIRLTGQQSVKALNPGKSARGLAKVTLPAGAAPGSYFLLACADGANKVKEKSEKNNCKASTGKTTVEAAKTPAPQTEPPASAGPPTGNTPTGDQTPPPGDQTPPPPPPPTDDDADGFIAGDCAPQDAKIFPGANDAPDPEYVDSNCDGIDGNAAGAIFVSPLGTDSATCGTRAEPCATIDMAGNRAVADGERNVYVAGGVYPRFTVRPKVNVYGGFGQNFQRDPAVAEGARTVAVQGAVDPATREVTTVKALEIPNETTLADLTLNGGNAETPGKSSYVVYARNAVLALDRVTIVGGNGAPGNPGAAGAAGTNGGTGGAGVNGGTAGTGFGTNGGVGGAPGNGTQSGLNGGNGQSAAGGGAFGFGGSGGFAGGGCGVGGPGGSAPDNASAGLPGFDGINGASGGQPAPAAFWQGGNGGNGVSGRSGGGGGAGGGGGGVVYFSFPSCIALTGGRGGGGGAGGAGGTGGTGGTAAGGSFGIYLVGSIVTVDSSSITSGAGGNGGPGGNGAPGGNGGAGGLPAFGQIGGGTTAGAGAPGKRGGDGGAGGAGAGGGGGPSVGIVKVGGASSATLTATTITAGQAGIGGGGGFSPRLGPAPNGASGFSAPVFPAS